jgi:hypothetical protein
MKKYCAACCVDAEDFSYQTPTWWDSALDYFSLHAEEVEDQAQQLAMDRDPMCGVVTATDRRAVTCAVGWARRPVSPWQMIRTADDALQFLLSLTEDHDDYQNDWGGDSYPKASKDQLANLAQELRCTLQEWEVRHGTQPGWFMVENTNTITHGLAQDAASLALLIDTQLERSEHDRARWFPRPLDEAEDDGKAREIKTLDLWEAASVCGLEAPERVKGGMP